MFKLQSLNGFEYTKTPYSELLDNIKQIPQYQTDLRGYSVQGREISGFRLGDQTKPTIYIQGNIHGLHEWRTVHWVKRFMEVLIDPPLSHKHIINRLKARYSFYFLPACNPDGYENNTYGNANGVSISRNFDYNFWEQEEMAGTPNYRGEHPFSEPESQIIRDVVLEIKPISFVCTHSWGGFTGFTTRYPQNREIDISIRDYYESLLLTSGISRTNTDVRMEPRLESSSAYNWAGEIMSLAGKKIYAHVLETGDRNTEYEQARLGLNGLLLHCIYVDAWFSKHKLKINS